MSWNFFTNTGSLKTSTVTSATMPAGTIMGYAGATAPLGFLFCDATAVSRAGYPQLFSAIGTTFGVGDGTTTFNLPDLRGRSIVGLGTNAAVNALALSDGVTTVANRRPQHQHTPHVHTLLTTNFQVGAAGLRQSPIAGGNNLVDVVVAKDGGSGISTDSLDAPAFLVTNYIISTTTVAPVVASNVTAYGGTVASASSIAITGNSTYLLTGTTGVSTATGATAGNTLTLVASGQATGVCVVLNNGVTANALNLRGSANLGLYVGDSITFVFNSSGYWVEIARSLKPIIDYVAVTTASFTINGTSAGAAITTLTGNAITFDGASAYRYEWYSPLVAIGTASNIQVGLWEDGTQVSSFGQSNNGAMPWMAGQIRTPTNASHTATIRSWVNSGSGEVRGGAGTGGANVPQYLRITREV